MAEAKIIPFEPPDPKARAFIYCEVHFEDDGNVVLTTVDEIGDRVVFGYLLVAKSRGE